MVRLPASSFLGKGITMLKQWALAILKPLIKTWIIQRALVISGKDRTILVNKGVPTEDIDIVVAYLQQNALAQIDHIV